MAKTGRKPDVFVGKIPNNRFAFFWMLLGGSLGNAVIILYAPWIWPLFAGSVLLSLLIVAAIAYGKTRPKLWLALDLVVTVVPSALIILDGATLKAAIYVPSALVAFGCVLGACDW